MLPYIVCYKAEMPIIHNNTSNPTMEICHKQAVKKKEQCYAFHWFNGKTMDENKMATSCSESNSLKHFSSISNIKSLEFIFKAVGQSRFKILFPYNSTSVKIYSYEMLLLKEFYKVDMMNISEATGFLTCVDNLKRANILTGNLFICSNGQSISSLYILDGDNDCYDANPGSDESSFPFKCDNPNCACSPLFYKSSNGDCIPYTSNESTKNIPMLKK